MFGLELRAFAIRSLIDEGELNVIWCSTDDQCADLLTKALGKDKFDKFSAILLGERANCEVKRALMARFVRDFTADVRARSTSSSSRTAVSALGGCVWAGATQPLSCSAARAAQLASTDATGAAQPLAGSAQGAPPQPGSGPPFCPLA